MDELLSQLKAGLISKDEILSKINEVNDSSSSVSKPNVKPGSSQNSVNKPHIDSDDELSDDGQRDSFDDLDETNEFVKGGELRVQSLQSEQNQPASRREAWADGETDLYEQPSSEANTLNADRNRDMFDSDSLAPTERLYRNAKLIEDRRRGMISKFKKEEEKKVMAECTFRPKLPLQLNKGEVVERGGYTAPTTAFKNKTTTRNAKHHPPPPSVTMVSESGDSTSKVDFDDEDLRFRRDGWLKFQGNGAVYEDTSECTFSPRTNKIKAERMPSAALYTKENIVTRLSPKNERAESPSSLNESKKADSDLQPPSIQQKLRTQYQTYQAEESSVSAASSIEQREARQIAPKIEVQHVSDVVSTTQSFHDMIKRQAQHLLKADENRRRSTTELTPTFKPHINRKSKDMVAHKGDFESRLALDILERDTSGLQHPNSNTQYGMNPGYSMASDSSLNLDSLVDGVCFDSDGEPYIRNSSSSFVSQRSVFIEDIVREDRRERGRRNQSEATFKPAITARATALPSRSFEEMSIGDSRRREDAVRKVLAQNARRESESLTLRPRITRKALRSPSHLRLQDADNYTIRVQDANTVRAEKLERIRREALETEKAQCTFKPNLSTCPSYVSRMAAAHSAKKMKPQSKDTKSKPDWR